MTKEEIANKEILIHDAMAKLQFFCKLYGIDSLFVVGGYCRSMLLDTLWDINDIDVASAYEEQAQQLCGLFASEVLKTTPELYKRSGAAAVTYETELGSIKIEFQGRSTNSYMYNREVQEWIHANDIDDVPLMRNIYGRDFTINALIYSFEKEKLFDPTNKAAHDLEKGIIRSLLPAEMLIQYNPLAILRAIRFALQYDFHIEEKLRTAMKSNIQQLSKTLSKERIMKELVRILKVNATDALEMIKNYNLESFLIDPEIKKHLSLEINV